MLFLFELNCIIYIFHVNIIINIFYMIKTYRIIIVGDSNVGKTAILNCFMEQKTNKYTKPTIGIDMHVKIYDIKNNKNNTKEKVSVMMCDLSGNKYYSNMLESYCENVGAVIIMYDVSNRNTYYSLEFWNKLLKKYLNLSKIPVILIGNKNDSLQVVKTCEGQKYALLHNYLFYETNIYAKNEYINNIFNEIIKKILNVNNLPKPRFNFVQNFLNNKNQIINKKKYNNNDENNYFGKCIIL
jgi:small GTP-binding protein